MSSNFQLALEQQKLKDYTSLFVVAVGYDYCLAFPKEVTFIWQRPWTNVSTMYLLIRYFGCLSVFVSALYGSSFLPGPLENPILEGNIFYLVAIWAPVPFFLSADIMMILRVYTMCNRSRTVLGVLLVAYVGEAVTFLIAGSIQSNPNYAAATVAQLLNTVTCDVTNYTQMRNIVYTVPQVIVSSVLCIFAVAQFMRESLRMYQVTQKLQPNKYMSLLIRDSILYLLAILFCNLLYMLGTLGTLPPGRLSDVFTTVMNVLVFALTPRFIINVRELCVLETQGCLDGGIDSGFGLLSAAGRNSGGSIGMMVFARARRNEGSISGGALATAERATDGGEQE